MIRTVLVDDEDQARRGLRTLLSRDKDIAIVGECSTGEEAIDVINREAPDLVLLDIDMPLGDGFDVLAEVDRSHSPFVIFVTAHAAFALQAFEVHALDYLLKPFDDDRFFAAIDHAKEQIRTRASADFRQRVARLLQHPEGGRGPTVTTQPDGPLKRIAVRQRDRIVYVPVAEIAWIEGAGYRVRVHARDGVHMVRGTIGSLERRLAGTPLVRVHRSAIVNVEAVKRVLRRDRGAGSVILRDGTEVRVSRSRRGAMEAALDRL